MFPFYPSLYFSIVDQSQQVFSEWRSLATLRAVLPLLVLLRVNMRVFSLFIQRCVCAKQFNESYCFKVRHFGVSFFQTQVPLCYSVLLHLFSP